MGATLWTLTLPILLVTIISFSYYMVPQPSVADRLSVTLTTILTIIAFQVVVREKVPAVPYRTLMDDYMLASLAVMALQVAGSVIVAWHAKRAAEELAAAQAEEAARRLATRTGSTTAAAESSALATDLDFWFLLTAVVLWFGFVLNACRKWYVWRRELAWFTNTVASSLDDCAKSMHQYDVMTKREPTVLLKKQTASVKVHPRPAEVASSGVQHLK